MWSLARRVISKRPCLQSSETPAALSPVFLLPQSVHTPQILSKNRINSNSSLPSQSRHLANSHSELYFDSLNYVPEEIISIHDSGRSYYTAGITHTYLVHYLCLCGLLLLLNWFVTHTYVVCYLYLTGSLLILMWFVTHTSVVRYSYLCGSLLVLV